MTITAFPIDVVQIHELPAGTPEAASYLAVSVGGLARRVDIAGLSSLLVTLLPEDTTATTAVSANGELVVGKTYYFDDSYDMTLQDPSGLAAGEYLAIMKKRGVFPTITVDGTLSEEIETDNGDDTAITFDEDAVFRIIWCGDNWNCVRG